MPPVEDAIIALSGFRCLKRNHRDDGVMELEVAFEGARICAHCGGTRLRRKAPFVRLVRHESVGNRSVVLRISGSKVHCLGCRRYSRPRYPGILPYQRVSEPFRREVVIKHHQGICQSTLAKHYQMGSATIERWYHRHLQVELREFSNRPCPRVLGIDEHFFTRKKGYATTLADLEKRRVFDIALGRSHTSLKGFLGKLIDKERVRVAVMDLSDTYRSIVRGNFPNALIVADRFHVIRLINHQFLKTWQQLDPQGRKNRGLLSLMRRHHFNLDPQQKERLHLYLTQVPALEAVYDFKQRLCQLMLSKSLTQRRARKLIPIFLADIAQLKACPFEPLRTLGCTLDSWKEEIGRMWRFTRTNSITEGLHNKMEMISRRAFGFRNFQNYRIRVRALCS